MNPNEIILFALETLHDLESVDPVNANRDATPDVLALIRKHGLLVVLGRISAAAEMASEHIDEPSLGEASRYIDAAMAVLS